MYVYCGMFVQQLLQWKKINIKKNVYVSVALHIQHAICEPHIALQNFSTISHK